MKLKCEHRYQACQTDQILQFLTTTFPGQLSLLADFPMFIRAKNAAFSHHTLYIRRHSADAAPGARSQTRLQSSAGVFSLRVSQHPDHQHKR